MAESNANVVRSIELIYARALVEMAHEAGQLEVVAEQMEDLEQLQKQAPELDRLLSAPTLTLEQRTALLEKVFKGRVHELVYRFLMVLNRKRRLNLAPRIIRAFRQVYDEVHGVVEVEAYAAQNITEMQRSRISSSLAQALGRQVVLHEHVDPALLGGLKLRIGDRLIDGSVANQLRLMREQIVRRGRERAREDLDRMMVETE